MKDLKRRPLRTAVAAAFCVSVPLAAHAGSGPYLGVDGGANWENAQTVRQDGNTVDTLHFKTGWAAGVNGGYSFDSGWRPELEIDHRDNYLKTVTTPGSAGFLGIGATPTTVNGGGHEYADTAMANLWYDLKAPTGLFSFIHPYIGGGVGGVRFANRNVSIGGSAPVANSHATEFGYQGGAGVGYDLTPRLTLSADYRFVQSNRGSFDVGSSNNFQARYRANTAMLGVRYSFGQPPAPPPPPPPAEVVEAPPPPPAPAPPPCNPPAGFQVDANCHIIEQKLIMRSVDFEFNSSQLTAPSQQSLDEVATALQAQPELNVEIRGYTDSIGSAAYNKKLSQRRAESVKAYLAGKGVAAGNLRAQGFGKSDPIASNDTAEGRAQNRRVEFVVTNTPAHVDVKTEGATAADTAAAEQGQQPKGVKKHHHHKKAAAPAGGDAAAPASGGDAAAPAPASGDQPATQ